MSQKEKEKIFSRKYRTLDLNHKNSYKDKQTFP